MYLAVMFADHLKCMKGVCSSDGAARGGQRTRHCDVGVTQWQQEVTRLAWCQTRTVACVAGISSGEGRSVFALCCAGVLCCASVASI